MMARLAGNGSLEGVFYARDWVDGAGSREKGNQIYSIFLIFHNSTMNQDLWLKLTLGKLRANTNQSIDKYSNL